MSAVEFNADRFALCDFCRLEMTDTVCEVCITCLTLYPDFFWCDACRQSPGMCYAFPCATHSSS